MNPNDCSMLRGQIQARRKELAVLEKQLGDAEKICAHDWVLEGPTTYGSDPVKYWKRTCNFCGKEEGTNKTTTKVIEVPDFYEYE